MVGMRVRISINLQKIKEKPANDILTMMELEFGRKVERERSYQVGSGLRRGGATGTGSCDASTTGTNSRCSEEREYMQRRKQESFIAAPETKGVARRVT